MRGCFHCFKLGMHVCRPAAQIGSCSSHAACCLFSVRTACMQRMPVPSILHSWDWGKRCRYTLLVQLVFAAPSLVCCCCIFHPSVLYIRTYPLRTLLACKNPSVLYIRTYPLRTLLACEISQQKVPGEKYTIAGCHIRRAGEGLQLDVHLRVHG